MRKHLAIFSIGFLCLFIFPAYAVEMDMRGYASIVAGKVVEGEQFLADYPKAGVYDDDVSMKPDTSVGLQFSADLGEGFSFTTQFISSGARDFDTEATWAYLNYQYNPELSVHIGRKRLPLYFYSDSFDLGFTYNWIRPPTDNYTWQISSYNGGSLNYFPQWGYWDTVISVYGGQEESSNNDLLSFLSDAEVDETWKNIGGIVFETSREWLEFRLSWMRSDLERTVNDMIIARNQEQIFSGTSVNLHFGNFSILSELTRYEREFNDTLINTDMVSAAYRIGQVTPHVTKSRFRQEENENGNDEHHFTNTYGIRWDVHSSVAIKLQYDKVTDKGVQDRILGDSKVYSIGIDVVF